MKTTGLRLKRKQNEQFSVNLTSKSQFFKFNASGHHRMDNPYGSSWRFFDKDQFELGLKSVRRLDQLECAFEV